MTKIETNNRVNVIKRRVLVDIRNIRNTRPVIINPGIKYLVR